LINGAIHHELKLSECPKLIVKVLDALTIFLLTT